MMIAKQSPKVSPKRHGMVGAAARTVESRGIKRQWLERVTDGQCIAATGVIANGVQQRMVGVSQKAGLEGSVLEGGCEALAIEPQILQLELLGRTVGELNGHLLSAVFGYSDSQNKERGIFDNNWVREMPDGQNVCAAFSPLDTAMKQSADPLMLNPLAGMPPGSEPIETNLFERKSLFECTSDWFGNSRVCEDLFSQSVVHPPR